MNKYQFVKEQLSAKEVVKDFLGEPQKISGDNFFWSSPFREGDSDPSLCVNEKQISDFGDETFKGQDIFSFVARYKNISNEEAGKQADHGGRPQGAGQEACGAERDRGERRASVSGGGRV